MPRKDTYILDRPTGRIMRARDALVCVIVAVLVLLVVQGQSIRGVGREDGAGHRAHGRARGRPSGGLDRRSASASTTTSSS